MGRWGDGEMGRWGDGEMGRKIAMLPCPPCPPCLPCLLPHTQCLGS
ncbi:hypothetical protein [Nostoc linckia]|nr:hypothetical protein [Nostoc linckia]